MQGHEGHWQDRSSTGFLAGLASVLLWGAFPLYWRMLAGIDPLEILSYRIIFSAVTVGIVVLLTGRTREVVSGMRNFSVAWRMFVTALLIGGNWYVFIRATTAGYVLESSLGYYLTPLLNAATGFLLLGERSSRLQVLGLAFAVFGVGISLFMYGTVPWITLFLGISFALYVFFRKTVQMESLPGLFVETLVLLPLALVYVLWLLSNGQGFWFNFSWNKFWLLATSGIVTSLPLMLYAFAARHMCLTTLGLVQYITPTCMLLLGIFVFREPIAYATVITLVCIWIGVALYSFDAILFMRKTTRFKKALG